MKYHSLAIAFSAVLAAALPAGAETFYDQARVIDVQPVYEARPVPVQAEQCAYEQPGTAKPVDPRALGDARSVDPGVDLFGALQRDAQLREPPGKVYRCRMVTRTESRQEMTGYRVRYAYEGRVHERRMSEHPGETIQVAVKVSVGGARGYALPPRPR